MPFAKNAMAVGIEAGYDVFSQVEQMRRDNRKLYVFGRFEKYNSYIPAGDQQKYEFTDRTRYVGGLNYFPVPQIAIKAEYSYRKLKSQYNDEPSLNIGVAYMGFFL